MNCFSKIKNFFCPKKDKEVGVVHQNDFLVIFPNFNYLRSDLVQGFVTDGGKLIVSFKNVFGKSWSTRSILDDIEKNNTVSDVFVQYFDKNGNFGYQDCFKGCRIGSVCEEYFDLSRDCSTNIRVMFDYDEREITTPMFKAMVEKDKKLGENEASFGEQQENCQEKQSEEQEKN